MATVYLHGSLQEFGGPFQLCVQSPGEAVKALCHQLRGFRRRLSEGAFHVVRRTERREKYLNENMIDMLLAEDHELHIMPQAAGAGGKGGKIILGIALVAAAFAFAPAGAGMFGTSLSTEAFSIFGGSVSWGNIAGFGVTMLLGGVSRLMSPTPSSTSSERPESRPSFIFNGPINQTEQGQPIPLLFGRFGASTVVMSATLSTEQISV